MTGQPEVLVVEDNDMIRKLVAAVLHQASIPVAEAASGAQGLELARSISPRVILLDMMFPDMSGVEFIEELRNRGISPSLRIIAMTAATQSVLPDGILTGSYGTLIHRILRKPVKEAELVAAVRECLA